MSRHLTAVVVWDIQIVVDQDIPVCSFDVSDLAIIIKNSRVFSETKFVKYKNEQKIIYQ